MNWETDKAEDIGNELANKHLQIVETAMDKFHEVQHVETIAAVNMLKRAAEIEEAIKLKYGVDIHIEFTVKILEG